MIEALMIHYICYMAKIQKICAHCNKLLYIYPSEIKRGGGRFCSRKCYFLNSKISRKGSNNPCYRGGKRTNKGYVLILKPDHPFTTKVGYVYEHRLVMEKHLKRYLTKKEVVHHKNKNKSDNRIENLELLPSHAEHLKKYHRPKWALSSE